MSYYEGMLVAPWGEIAIQYVLVCSHVAKRRPDEGFKEHSKLVKCVHTLLAYHNVAELDMVAYFIGSSSHNLVGRYLLSSLY
jgi:hypothetical protein